MVLTMRAVLEELDRLAGRRRPHDRRDRPRRDRRVGRARGAARRPRQQRRDPLAADPRRRRGALQPARRADRPDADRRRARARRRPRLRLGARARRGDDPDRRARDGAAASRVELAHMPDAAARAARPRSEVQDDAIASVLERAVAAGEASVMRTPDLLAVLRDAGVVDAGGYALVVIFAGIVAALRGDEPPPLRHHTPARVTHPQHDSSTFRYCTNFAVTGSRLDSARITRRARRARRLGARRRRRAHAQDPRPHRPARAGDRGASPRPARSRTSTSPTCTPRSRARERRLAEPAALRRARGRRERRHRRRCSAASARTCSTAGRR